MARKLILCAFLLAGIPSSGLAQKEQGHAMKPGESNDIRVDATASGPVITDFGYDVKQPGKAKAFNAEDAKDIFKADGFTCLRIPIWGDINQPAHPAPGTIVAKFYEPVLTSMKLARAMKPDVIFFASKRLEGKKS